MNSIFLVLLLLFNFGVSIWNAHVAGKIWYEAKALGGWMRALAWSAAIQSASGFMMVYTVVAGAALLSLGMIHGHAVHAMMALTYLLVIVPVLGTGLLITVESWIMAFRDRSYANMGLATLNTVTTAYNLATAFDGGISSAVEAVQSFFSEDEDDDAVYAEVAVLMALVLSIGCTCLIMRRSMRSLPPPEVAATRYLSLPRSR